MVGAMANLFASRWARVICRKPTARSRWLEDPHAPQLKPVAEAIEAYKQHIRPLEAATQRKYANVLKSFLAHSEQAGLKYLADWGVEELDDYRSARKLASSTSATELTILRTFLAFSVERRWIADNPAQKIKPPRNLKPAEVAPYEPNEIARMLAACDVFGISSYERLRARAMVLVMRYTGPENLRRCYSPKGPYQERANLSAHQENRRHGVSAGAETTGRRAGRSAGAAGSARQLTLLFLERNVRANHGREGHGADAPHGV